MKLRPTAGGTILHSLLDGNLRFCTDMALGHAQRMVAGVPGWCPSTGHKMGSWSHLVSKCFVSSKGMLPDQERTAFSLVLLAATRKATVAVANRVR